MLLQECRYKTIGMVNKVLTVIYTERKTAIRIISARLAEQEINLEISPSAKHVLISKGTDVKFGARPLRRAIQKNIEDELAERILARDFAAGDVISVRKSGDGLDFVKKDTSRNKRAKSDKEASYHEV